MKHEPNPVDQMQFRRIAVWPAFVAMVLCGLNLLALRILEPDSSAYHVASYLAYILLAAAVGVLLSALYLTHRAQKDYLRTATDAIHARHFLTTGEAAGNIQTYEQAQAAIQAAYFWVPKKKP